MFSRALLAWLCVGLGTLSAEPVPRAKVPDKAPQPSLAGFPKLTGKLRHMLGHEMGFIRPRPGEPFRLELADIAKVKKLAFDPKRNSYIPLAGPIAVEGVHYHANGAFRSMRLVSRKRSGGRIAIDVVPHPGEGPNRVRVWVLIESSEVVLGVALIECEADGKFPGRQK